MHRQYRLGETTLLVANRHLYPGRVRGHIVRQSWVEIGLLLRVTQRGSRLFTYLGHQAYRSGTVSLLYTGNDSDRNSNGVYFAHTNEAHARGCYVFSCYLSVLFLARHFQLCKFTLEYCTSTVTQWKRGLILFTILGGECSVSRILVKGDFTLVCRNWGTLCNNYNLDRVFHLTTCFGIKTTVWGHGQGFAFCGSCVLIGTTRWTCNVFRAIGARSLLGR